uniref:No apical meristem-associated C-terminal domain-containing protein n=1 Tax=Oryza brachyantha TaxID=4533 RepID=J3MJ68_ORYBR
MTSEKRQKAREELSTETDSEDSPPFEFPRGKMTKGNKVATKGEASKLLSFETPRKSIDYMRCMGKTRVDRLKAPEQQYLCEADYRFKTQASTNPVAKQVIKMCIDKDVGGIMCLDKDWNEELIGQFFATIFFEKTEDGTEQQMRWLTEGEEYTVTMSQFATILGLGAFDLNKPSIHAESPMSSEVQIILDVSRGLAYAPFLHLMIEIVTGLRFVADCAHRSYNPILPKVSKAKEKSSASSRPSTSQIPEHPSLGSLSPFKKALSAIFGICKKTAVKVKSTERKVNQLLHESGHEIPSESKDKALPPQPPRFMTPAQFNLSPRSHGSWDPHHYQQPCSNTQATEGRGEQETLVREEVLEPLNHESTGVNLSRDWSTGEDDFLQRSNFSNFNNMASERFYTNLLSENTYTFDYGDMGSQPEQEQPNRNEPGKSRRQSQKRTKNFSDEEDYLLVSAWLNISLDAVQGVDQSKSTYWNRIYKYFHEHKTFNSDRSQGYSITVGLLSHARKLYKAENENRAFTYIECYHLLKNQPKWFDKRIEMSHKSTTKSTAVLSTDVPSEGNIGDRSETTRIDAATNTLERPVGRKEMKEKLRQRFDRSHIESLDYLWAKKKEADEEKEIKKEERYNHAFTLEEQRIAMEKEKFEFKRTIEEERILRTDVSNMDIS